MDVIEFFGGKKQDTETLCAICEKKINPNYKLCYICNLHEKDNDFVYNDCENCVKRPDKTKVQPPIIDHAYG